MNCMGGLMRLLWLPLPQTHRAFSCLRAVVFALPSLLPPLFLKLCMATPTPSFRCGLRCSSSKRLFLIVQQKQLLLPRALSFTLFSKPLKLPCLFQSYCLTLLSPFPPNSQKES